ncbi:hypothetical protein V8F33_006754 [Rhypophila sp. PSN 637]
MDEHSVLLSSFDDFVHVDQHYGDSSSDGFGDFTMDPWDHAEQADPAVAEPTAPVPVLNQSPQPQPNQIVMTSRAGPEKQEWEERRPLITLLYGPEKPSLNLTFQELMTVMDKAGFLKGASADMYKNRFSKWGIVKNESNAARRRRARRQQPSGSSRTSADLTSSPPRPSQSPPSQTRVTFGEVVKNMRAICAESIKEKPNGTWNLDDDFCVIDDDWEDAYGSAAALTLEACQDPESTAASSPWETIRKDIAPMVKSLNYFSLPTILMITYLMCKKLGDPKVRHVPASFLDGCLQVSRAESEKSPRHVWLTSLLEGLYDFARQENNIVNLAEILNLTIPCYIQLVSDYGNREGATALPLLSFYHVQLGSDILWLESTLEKIMRLLSRVEASKGPYDKATIEILGLTIMVLQETKQDKKLMLETAKMGRRAKRQLDELHDDHPDRKFYLDRLLDGYHLEMRAALETGQKEDAKVLKKDYEVIVRQEDKEKDGYAKILDLELDKLAGQLESTTLGCE